MSVPKKFNVHAKVWLYPGESGNWHFITVPKKESAEIKKQFGSLARGWGSLPVSVTIGKTSWATSIFSDRASGCYMLPLKANVRAKEGIYADDIVKASFIIVLP